MSKEYKCKCCQAYWYTSNAYWYTSNLKNGLCPNCYDYVADLEARLAEKEKQIETQKSNIKFLYDLFVSPKGEQTLKAINQDKISFCVEQLENAKEIVNKTDKNGYLIQFANLNEKLKFYKEIDNQIKQLKGEK